MKNYRIKSFPSFWSNIDELIDDGVIAAHVEVLRELEKQEDELYDWAKARLHLFREIDEHIESAVRKISKQFPTLVDYRRDRSGADPWVIALAFVEGAAVVSDENRGKRDKPKIPDVCEKLGIRHVRVADLIEEQGWQY